MAVHHLPKVKTRVQLPYPAPVGGLRESFRGYNVDLFDDLCSPIYPMKLLVKGVPASQGKAQGKARVIHLDMDKNRRLKEGEILVTYITDASMFVDIIGKAKAIITDVGGITSHPAIVARELGLPCVVATKIATKVIKTGMEVIVDGNKGVVYEAS